MIDLADPRTRMRLAAAADVCMPTLLRFAKGGAEAVKTSSARRINEALALFERQDAERAARK